MREEGVEGEEGRGRGRRPQRLAADQTLLSPAQPSAAAAAKGAPFTCVFVGQRHKAEGEDVAAAAGVALEHGVTQRGVSVQGYLAGLGLNLQQRRGGGGQQGVCGAWYSEQSDGHGELYYSKLLVHENAGGRSPAHLRNHM